MPFMAGIFIRLIIQLGHRLVIVGVEVLNGHNGEVEWLVSLRRRHPIITE